MEQFGKGESRITDLRRCSTERMLTERGRRQATNQTYLPAPSINSPDISRGSIRACDVRHLTQIRSHQRKHHKQASYIKEPCLKEHRRTLGMEVKVLKQLKNFALTIWSPECPGQTYHKKNCDSCSVTCLSYDDRRMESGAFKWTASVGIPSCVLWWNDRAARTQRAYITLVIHWTNTNSGVVFPNAIAQSPRTKGQSTRKR